MAGSRGLGWRRNEIVDLLEIWGDHRMQTALRQSHRNHDIFEEIAGKMLEKGHQRTADECRTKTKAMRQAYKKVLSHNNKSGNSPTTCPFFEDLDRILQGDPSVKRRRTSQSLCRKTQQSAADNETVFTLNLTPVLEDIDGTAEQVSEQDYQLEEEPVGEQDIPKEPEDTQARNLQNVHNRTIDGRLEEHGGGEEEAAPRNPRDIPPGVALSDLSPPSRLALRAERKSKQSAMQRVGEMMVRQSSREHRTLMESSNREHNQLMAALGNTQEDDKTTNRELCGLFRETLTAITEMTKTINNPPQACTGVCHSNECSPRNRHVPGITVEHDSHVRRPGRRLFRDQDSAIRHNYHEVSLRENAHVLQRSRILEEEGVAGNSLTDVPRVHLSERNHINFDHRRELHNTLSERRVVDRLNPDPLNSEVNECCISNRMVEDNDSEDYVGTHVWGETPADTQWLRDHYIPFNFNVPITNNLHLSAGKTISNVADMEMERFKKKGTPRKLSMSMSHLPVEEEHEESQSLLSLPRQRLDFGSTVTCRSNLQGQGKSYEVTLPTSSVEKTSLFEEGLRDHFPNGSKNGNNGSVNKNRELLSDNSMQHNSNAKKGRGKQKSSPTRKESVVDSPNVRAKRKCKPKVIFSPDC